MQSSQQEPEEPTPVILPFPRTPADLPVPDEAAPGTGAPLIEPPPGSILPLFPETPVFNQATATFHYHGCAIRVATPSSNTLRWLEEFFGTSFEVSSCLPTGDDHRVWSVTLEHVRHQEPPKKLANWIECFTLDGSFERYRLETDSGTRRVLWHPEHAVRLEIDATARTVNIACPAAEASRGRMVLMRTVREIATAHALQDGMLHVHGAAFRHGENTIMLTGPKTAGKTSSLLYALHHGAQLLGNDRLLVGFDQQPVVRGMPTVVKVRPESLRFFPKLARRHRIRPYKFVESMEESLRRVRWSTTDGNADVTPRLTNTQLCDLLGIGSAKEAPLTAIFFPRVDARVQGFAVRRVVPAAAADRLWRECLLRPGKHQRISPALGVSASGEGIDPQTEQAQCLRLAQHVPCFELQLGLAAYEMPQLFHYWTSGKLSRRTRTKRRAA